jgi:hypothetical protein
MDNVGEEALAWPRMGVGSVGGERNSGMNEREWTGMSDRFGTRIYVGDRCVGGTVVCQDGFTLVNDRPTTVVRRADGVYMLGSISLMSLARATTVVVDGV